MGCAKVVWSGGLDVLGLPDVKEEETGPWSGLTEFFRRFGEVECRFLEIEDEKEGFWGRV